MAAGAIGNLMPTLGPVNFWLLHFIIVGGAALGLFFFWRLFHRILAPHRPDLDIAPA